MVPSNFLISKANDFLDGLASAKKESDRKKLAKKLENNISELADYKQEMLHAGFNSPFLGLLAITREELDEADEAESQDVAKHMEKIQQLARMKKYSLNRVRIALAAHKMALGIVKENFAEQLLEGLPLDGNYIATIVRTKEAGLHAYKSLMALLAAETESAKSIFVTIEYDKDGVKEQKTFKLASAKNIEEKIRRDFGESAKVVSTRMGRNSDVFMKKKSARACVSAAYTLLAFKHASSNSRKRSALMQRYAEFMSRKGFEANARIDAVEGYEEIKQELEKQGFAESEGDEYFLKKELQQEISSERTVLRESCERKARQTLAFDLFKYFLLFPKREREAGAIFPSLNANVSKEKLEFMNVLNALGIEDAAGTILRKLEAEKLALKLDSRVFGSAFFYLTAAKDLDWCSQHFGVEKEKIKAGAITLAPHVDCLESKLAELGIKKSERAERFAELVRNSGEKEKAKPKKASASTIRKCKRKK